MPSRKLSDISCSEAVLSPNRSAAIAFVRSASIAVTSARTNLNSCTAHNTPYEEGARTYSNHQASHSSICCQPRHYSIESKGLNPYFSHQASHSLPQHCFIDSKVLFVRRQQGLAPTSVNGLRIQVVAASLSTVSLIGKCPVCCINKISPLMQPSGFSFLDVMPTSALFHYRKVSCVVSCVRRKQAHPPTECCYRDRPKKPRPTIVCHGRST